MSIDQAAFRPPSRPHTLPSPPSLPPAAAMGPGHPRVGSSPAFSAENIAVGAEPAPTDDDEKG